MANGFLLRSVPLVAGNFLTNTWGQGYAGAFPITNLANPQPKVVAQTTGVGNPIGVLIDIDLGADTSIDTLIVMHTNLSTAAIWRVYGANQATGLPAMGTEPNARYILGFTDWAAFGVAATTRQRRRHALAIGSPVTVRYIRIYLQDYPASNPDNLARIGTIGVGLRWQPAFNFELGGGRRIDDRSLMRDLPGGEIGGLDGAKVPITRVTWGDMTDTELQRLWSVLLDVGESDPLFLVEDPDLTTGQVERIHYGVLTGLDFFERTIPDKSKIELRLKEWL